MGKATGTAGRSPRCEEQIPNIKVILRSCPEPVNQEMLAQAEGSRSHPETMASDEQAI
ncbi:MAG TPA: hypothetical protein VKA08_15740 [Balneolales bacterium]|nr:hypothetical protein [Balneolales bacterium]